MPQPANEPFFPPVGRLCPDPALGLTDEQAAARAAAGLVNTAPPSLVKTTGQILRDNLFTFYNLVFVLLAGCLCAVGAFGDMLFLGVVVCNAAIGILQELRVRAVLQKAVVLQQSPVKALPGGLCAAAALLFVSWLGGRLGLGVGQVSSVCTLLLGVNGLCALLLLCRPLTRLRAAVIGLMALGFVGAVGLLPGFFGIEPLCAQSRQIFCAVGAAIPAAQWALGRMVRLCKKYCKKGAHTR